MLDTDTGVLAVNEFSINHTQRPIGSSLKLYDDETRLVRVDMKDGLPSHSHSMEFPFGSLSAVAY